MHRYIITYVGPDRYCNCMYMSRGHSGVLEVFTLVVLKPVRCSQPHEAPLAFKMKTCNGSLSLLPGIFILSA